jgi:putative inorganic carbon (HCO3(-)) transporter
MAARLALPALVLWLLIALTLDRSGVSFARDQGNHYVYGSVLAGYCAFLLLRRRLPGRTPLDVPLATLVAVGALAVAASPYRATSLEAGLTVAALVVVFYALNDCAWLGVDALVRSLLAIVSFLAVTAIVWFGLQYLSDIELKRAVLGELSPGDMVPTWYRPYMFHHANVLAGVLNFALPFALALVIRPGRRVERLFAASVLGVCLLAMLLTNSRGGWLGLAAALPCFLFLNSLAGSRLNSGRVHAWFRAHRTRLGVGAVAAGIFGAAAVALLLVAEPPWLLRATAVPRLELARVAIDMVADRPALGSGPRTFGFFNTSYGDVTSISAHPHNQYLDIAVSSGLLGIVVAAVLVAAAGRMLLDAIPQLDARRRAFAAACAAALVSLLVHGLVETPLHFVGSALLLVVVLVIAARVSGTGAARAWKPSVASRVAILAIVPACLFVWLTSQAAHSHYDRSLTLLEAGRLEAAAGYAERAAVAGSDSIAYQIHAGVLSALLYQQQMESGVAGGISRLNRSVEYLTRATELDPRSYVAYANLAQAQRLLGNEAEAVEAARRAFELTPHDFIPYAAPGDPMIAIAAGTVLEWAGYREEAASAYAVAFHMNPALSQIGFWSQSPERWSLRMRAIELSGMSPCVHGRNAALYGSFGDDLADLARECRAVTVSAEDRAALAVMLERQGRHEEAIGEVLPAASASGSATVQVAFGYVLAGEDPERARKAFLKGGDEGLLFLALTYDVGAARELIQLPPDWPTVSGPVPDALLERLPSDPAHRSWYIYLNYAALLRREQPGVTLIPGEWQDIRSPLASMSEAISAWSDGGDGRESSSLPADPPALQLPP